MNEELNKKSVSGAENEDARDISDASCMILDKRVNKSKLVTDFTRHSVPFTEKIQWHNFSRDGQTAKDVSLSGIFSVKQGFISYLGFRTSTKMVIIKQTWIRPD